MKSAFVVLGCSLGLFSCTLSGQSTPSVPMQILEQHRVNVGTHTVTYNRVAPPVFPAPVVQVRPTPPLTPQYLAWEQARAQMNFKFLMIGATIYDYQFSDVSWFDGDQWVRVISNIDFNYFTGIGEFDTADTIYQYFMASSNETGDGISLDTTTLSYLVQARLQLSSTSAGYIVVEGNPTANADALADLDALHAYFNVNRAVMIQDYRQMMAKEAAQAAWNKAHPPVIKDTVINYWPIKSSVYLKGANQ